MRFIHAKLDRCLPRVGRYLRCYQRRFDVKVLLGAEVVGARRSNGDIQNANAVASDHSRKEEDILVQVRL